MSKQLKFYGNPEGSVFGIIGANIDTDEEKNYYKISDDTRNIGWYTASIVPTPTPMPTPTPLPPFSCAKVEITGSTKCNNPVGLYWSLNASASVSYSVSWTVPASTSSQVNIYGNGGTVNSLTNGETKFNSIEILPPNFGYGAIYSRNSNVLDTVKIVAYINSGPNFSRVGGISYTSGSTPVDIVASNIENSYKYHTRKKYSSDYWSGTLYYTSQTISTTGSNFPELFFGEVVDSNANFSFPVEPSSNCDDYPPVPQPTSGPYCIQFWINYDYNGRFLATWTDCTGSIKSSNLYGGVPYTTAKTDCHQVDTLSVIHGSNFRFGDCGDTDPRTGSFQIDATFNADGQFDFDYLNPYGVQENISQYGSPDETVYSAACGSKITNVNIGLAELTSRTC